MKTIGIKLADGSFYSVLEEGKAGEARLDLTTVHNNQTRVMVDLYRSKTNSMDDAEYVDTLQIDHLVEHPNGEPNLSFIVSLDENNELSAKIIDPETGAQSDTNITLVSRTLEERLITDNYDIAKQPEDPFASAPDEEPEAPVIENTFTEPVETAVDEEEVIADSDSIDLAQAAAVSAGLLATAAAIREDLPEEETPAEEAPIEEESVFEEPTESLEETADEGLPVFTQEPETSFDDFPVFQEDTTSEDEIPATEDTSITDETTFDETSADETAFDETLFTEAATEETVIDDLDLPDFGEDESLSTEEETAPIQEEISEEIPESFDIPEEEPVSFEVPEETPDTFDIPEEEPENSVTESLFGFDLPSEDDFNSPDFSDINFDIPEEENIELNEEDFVIDDILSASDEALPATNELIDGLYDDNGNVSDDDSFFEEETENEKKKTKTPVIICIICAIICIIATILVLFVIPSKYNLLNKNKTEETVVVAPPEPVKTEEPKPEPEPVKEEIPAAVEDEIIVIEKAEEVLPEPPAPPKVEPQDITYKIKWGDTLWDIADTYYKNPWRYHKIAKYNGIKDPDYIISGTYIKIPVE